MSEAPKFSLTEDQKAELTEWRLFLNDNQAQSWEAEEKQGFQSMASLLKGSGFGTGTDLTEQQFDQMFKYMKKLSSNRWLANKLYADNGIQIFNDRLRALLYGTAPLVQRLNDFLSLKHVGVFTMSQFLCCFNPGVYPMVTPRTVEILGLDGIQMETAKQQAVDENAIDPNEYLDKTIEYLQHLVVFREVKRLAGVASYDAVNRLLWKAQLAEGPEPLEMASVSLSLEKDLRDYLAANPHMVERGLSLVKKEYATKAGPIDVLCQTKTGEYLVIETKKGKGSDQVVGQVLRYLGALKQEGKSARGLIVVQEPDDNLTFAVSAIEGLVKLKYYSVRFEIDDSPPS